MNAQIARYGKGYEVVFQSWVVYHDPNPDGQGVCRLLATLPEADLARLARARVRLSRAWHAPVWSNGVRVRHDEADRNRYARLRETLNQRALRLLWKRHG